MLVDFDPDGASGGHVDRACQMKRVAVFGNAGGGKSTLARRLADLTRLPLYPLDMIQFRAGGGRVPHEQYLKAHADLLRQDEWIIDGLGWPENSPMWRGTMDSYKVVWLCHRRLTPRYRQLVADLAASKHVHHVRLPAEMSAFLNSVKRAYMRA